MVTKPLYPIFFTNFKPNFNFSYDNDWNLYGEFKKFATVPDKFLKKEKDLRMNVIDTLSGYYSLSRTASLHESKNELVLMRSMLTSMRCFAASLKHITISWIRAKVDVRRIFLKDSKSTYAQRLLISNPW